MTFQKTCGVSRETVDIDPLVVSGVFSSRVKFSARGKRRGRGRRGENCALARGPRRVSRFSRPKSGVPCSASERKGGEAGKAPPGVRSTYATRHRVCVCVCRRQCAFRSLVSPWGPRKARPRDTGTHTGAQKTAGVRKGHSRRDPACPGASLLSCDMSLVRYDIAASQCVSRPLCFVTDTQRPADAFVKSRRLLALYLAVNSPRLVSCRLVSSRGRRGGGRISRYRSSRSENNRTGTVSRAFARALGEIVVVNGERGTRALTASVTGARPANARVFLTDTLGKRQKFQPAGRRSREQLPLSRRDFRGARETIGVPIFANEVTSAIRVLQVTYVFPA